MRGIVTAERTTELCAGPGQGRSRALRTAAAALGWLAVAAMLALGSTGVRLDPEPTPADVPAALAAGR